MKIVMASGVEKDAPPKLKTVYVFDGEIVRVTRGTNLFEAGPNVQRNLQSNRFGASYAEVLDAETDQLYYSQSRHMDGKLSAPHYEWNPEETEKRLYGVSTMLPKRK